MPTRKYHPDISRAQFAFRFNHHSISQWIQRWRVFFFFFIVLTFASQKLVRSYIIGERKEIRLPRIYKEYLPVDLPRQCHR